MSREHLHLLAQHDTVLPAGRKFGKTTQKPDIEKNDCQGKFDGLEILSFKAMVFTTFSDDLKASKVYADNQVRGLATVSIFLHYCGTGISSPVSLANWQVSLGRGLAVAASKGIVSHDWGVSG
jgi:hypothetical protein